MKLENYYNPDYAGLQQYPLNLTEVELLHNLIKEKNEINLSAVEHYYDNNKAVIDESVDGELMKQLSQYIADIRVLKGIMYLIYRYDVNTEYVDTTQRITYDENSIGIIDRESYFHVNITRIVFGTSIIGDKLLLDIISNLTILRYADSRWEMSFTKLLINALCDVMILLEKKKLNRQYGIEEIFDVVYSAYNLNVEDSERKYKVVLSSSWNDSKPSTGIVVPKGMKYHTVLSNARKKYVERYFDPNKTIKDNLEYINKVISMDYPTTPCIQFALRTLKSIIGNSAVVSEMREEEKEVIAMEKSIKANKNAMKDKVLRLYNKLKDKGYSHVDISTELKRKGYKVSKRTLYRWLSDS